MPRIFEDATLTLPNGDVYLFEDTDRLRRDNQRPKVQRAKQSMRDMLEYIFKIYPGFRPCSGSDSSCEEDEYIRTETEKVLREVAKGVDKPTPQEWRDRTDATLAEIRSRHRKSIEPVFFRISKEGQHIGAMLLDEIFIENITEAGVRRVSVNASIAIDDGRDNNDLWQRLYARFAIAMLKNRFLKIEGDDRIFQIMRVGIPDVYEGTHDVTVNAKLLEVLDANAADVEYQLYSTNDGEQTKIGFKRVKSATLKAGR